MAIKLFNTLTKDYEVFQPLDPKKVNMYVCGITPYDETHLGHGRAYVTFDVIRRYLEFSGYQVNYVQNITDIDDKIIKRANELKISTGELTAKYINSYFDVMDKLNVIKATQYPKATEHIKEMILVIEKLIKGGFAYVVSGPASASSFVNASEDKKASAGRDVYFEVAKFKDYGKLSKRKLDELKDGARVAVDERKRSPLDFALWKSAKEGEPSWDSPWGKGRPGWHIECSTMSAKYLGETFDIHGGGLDLIFPHHENEIAQAECATGKPFAKYWIHNGFVNVNHEKMSKSLGNFFTLRDIFKKFNPMLIRFYLISTHYRSPINFSDTDIENAKGGLERLANAFAIVRQKASCSTKKITDKRLSAIKDSFIKAMDSDFNTPEALSSVYKLCDIVFELAGEAGASDDLWAQVTGLFEEMVVDVFGINVQTGEVAQDIEVLAKEMETARVSKNYKRSDELRDLIASKGYNVEIAKDNKVKLRRKV